MIKIYFLSALYVFPISLIKCLSVLPTPLQIRHLPAHSITGLVGDTHTHCTIYMERYEAEFLDLCRTKVWRVFLLAIHSHHYYGFNPSKSGLKVVCKHCIWKPHVRELSRLCPETSRKLYAHEFGFWWKDMYADRHLVYSRSTTFLCTLKVSNRI